MLPDDRVTVTLEMQLDAAADADTRTVVVEPTGASWSPRVGNLRRALARYEGYASGLEAGP